MLSDRSGITAAGTWIVDYAKLISQFPDEGACASVFTETTHNGGAPYNLLVNLCRLGSPFPLRGLGCLGQDLDGDSIMKDCKAHAIDTARIRTVPGAATSFSDVMIARETGVRTSFNHAGANDLLRFEDFDFDENPSRILFLGSLFFLAGLDAKESKFGTFAASVLAHARRRGMLTCVDIERTNVPLSLFQESARASLKQTDLVILNVEVAEMLSMIRIRFPSGVDLFAAERAATELRALAQARCVVIRFPSGAFALAVSGERIAQGSVSLPKSRIVSAAGAGHAFTSGFLYGYHENWPLEDCLKAANATAAACLTDQTASGGIRKLSDCLKRLEKYGQRRLESMRIDQRE